MKIQWNSDAAQEVLERLKRAQEDLDDSMAQAHRIDTNLEEANADGEDSALRELAERLGECRKKLLTLVQQLSDFRDALNRADAGFDDTEQHNRHMAADLDVGRAPIPGGMRDRGSANWESSAYAVMPEMHTQEIPLPGWLGRVTARTDLL